MKFSERDNFPVHVPWPAEEDGSVNSQGISILRCSVCGRWNWARKRSSLVGFESFMEEDGDESRSWLMNGKPEEALRRRSNGEAIVHIKYLSGRGYLDVQRVRDLDYSIVSQFVLSGDGDEAGGGGGEDGQGEMRL